ncbi:MAG: RNA methyltransferase, TrmH family [Candidatus Falkowbacteria bacterium GW2011_GWC2_38_22]|uniref:RNA methyltransferase, TrmH family n=1 Tax=Candidatus Falkowbacteria bacterium GW2011_GWE1_38_31 TaxID=1618638 RepID=A0A0G0JRP3_9BACT|nr:MAG: RNA methyltransferase, TrmH family [Candidatus Falkowbacteria bacterium GW2011_GWF2_38_1205]KKQ60458.1 MAG: RNA methyltransferase, TrmH family [Candidatus Falkowbacteria bacterium GW2011_GWC2_38_22]KKQ62519.1 MAG: RNA methyltransferase, TrmH family [Candidatus Falkowbacteria bacterium GW2011_GWF1_38_22]KKQ64580.1 MAG: RNA methyltransferase, TrmH family [Candidatus Falkowbacteria bacterium GW2011_GWE2_38_254]KKQ69412.1 MAG: RNA methyltransferase, TrmH family [Candidatus Falkowbacteria ba
MDIKKISSSENEQIRLLKKLGQKKYRDEYGKFVVENYAIIHDALIGGFDCESLFVTDVFVKKQDEKTAFLFAKAKTAEKYVIDDRLNKKFSELDCPSGVAAICKKNKNKIDLKLPAVYLNGISDPGNVGTIMRTALAFGFRNIIVDSGCADIYNPKTISAAKDSVFKLNIIEDTNGDWLLKNRDNYCLVSANSNKGKELKDFSTKKKICLILGSESHGISKDVLDIVDENIKINISSEIESLNVASAAAILLHNFSTL